jgi:Zn-dependent protease with chaperone function
MEQLDQLVHYEERVLFGVLIGISILSYLLLVISIVGIFYIIFGAIVMLFVQGLFVGSLRGNAILLSEKQFPDAYRTAQQLAVKMGIQRMPEIYLQQAGGMINAFATKLLSRDFVVIYSDVFELAYNQGEAELAFVLAHELAHVKREHMKWRWVLTPALLLPFLSHAYYRACEITCDCFAAHFRPDGAVNGLLVLAAGKRLYQKVNAVEYVAQIEKTSSFWTSFAEALATHPNLPKRVRMISQVLSPGGAGVKNIATAL